VDSKTGAGWRSLFKIVGAAGSLWVIFWLLSTRGERAQEMTPMRTTWRSFLREVLKFTEVFKLRTFWITMAVGIAVNMAWHLYRVWLPRHLVRDLEFTDEQLQYLLMGYFVVADLGSIAFGYATKRVIAGGTPVERARRMILLVAAVVCLAGLIAILKPGRWIMVPAYYIVGAGIMGVFAMFYSFVQDIHPSHTSKCLGIIGATVWLIVSTLHPLIGRFADTSDTAIGKFTPFLMAAGSLPLIAALIARSWPDKKEVAAS
jgi:ACS family hexuronate transporter-like MFS transporter